MRRELKPRRRVGPEQLTHIGLRPPRDETGERNLASQLVFGVAGRLDEIDVRIVLGNCATRRIVLS